MTKAFNWLKLIEEKEEDILEKIKQGYLEAYGGPQGWFLYVEMDREGKVWTTGYFSNGQSVSSWEGETLIIATLRTWEIDIDITECSFQEEELRKKYEKEHEKTEIDLWDFLQEFYPGKIEEWEANELDWVKNECLDDIADLHWQRMINDLNAQL